MKIHSARVNTQEAQNTETRHVLAYHEFSCTFSLTFPLDISFNLVLMLLLL